jgi:hypothetical protein
VKILLLNQVCQCRILHFGFPFATPRTTSTYMQTMMCLHGPDTYTPFTSTCELEKPPTAHKLEDLEENQINRLSRRVLLQMTNSYLDVPLHIHRFTSIRRGTSFRSSRSSNSMDSVSVYSPEAAYETCSDRWFSACTFRTDVYHLPR